MQNSTIPLGALDVLDEKPIASLKTPAKTNFYLGIKTSRDERGYHDVDTVMCKVSLFDSIDIYKSDSLKIISSPALDVPQEKSTSYKAALAFGKVFNKDVNFDIHIERNIPSSSGLGAPSSDAAGVLKALCEIYDIDAREPRIIDIARRVGADVPFFLYDSPAYMAGSGDVYVRSFASISLPLVLVRPKGDGVPTVLAYKIFDENAPELSAIDPILDALDNLDVPAVVKNMHNNLNEIATQIAPEIKRVHSWLSAQSGVEKVMVSGSGSCSFAVCNSYAEAERIASAAQKIDLWSSAVRTI